ncbi:MAG: hypothetical protein IJB64_07400 [Akkermansia sp.]|nr:hypothetical protein [Akkermansia sp.]
MKYTTHKGKTYTVTTSEPCTITTDTGIILCSVEPGKQADFVAIGSTIEVDSEVAEITENASETSSSLGFNAGEDIRFTGNLYKTNSEELDETSLLNRAEGDNRWKINFDTTPTSGSTNAVTSGGLYNLLVKRDQNIGLQSKASGSYSSAFGGGANATGFGATAIGFWSQATQIGATAVGEHASGSAVGATILGAASQVTKVGGMALGRKVINKDEQAMVLGTLSANDATQTLFYIIGAGSPLATTYEDGEACLGYVVKESNGNILACGTRKLSELLTNNTAFAPAALDLDAPASTPFLPTGITDPIEIEELTD